MTDTNNLSREVTCPWSCTVLVKIDRNSYRQETSKQRLCYAETQAQQFVVFVHNAGRQIVSCRTTACWVGRVIYSEGEAD